MLLPDGVTRRSRVCALSTAPPNRTDEYDEFPHDFAWDHGHFTMAAWLRHISRVGWKNHLSEPRYKLVVLRELVARNRVRRRRADPGEEQLLDFLFPSDQSRRRARRHHHRLPDELFSVIAQYYWGGGMSAEEEVAAADEAAARAASDEEEEEGSESEESEDD